MANTEPESSPSLFFAHRVLTIAVQMDEDQRQVYFAAFGLAASYSAGSRLTTIGGLFANRDWRVRVANALRKKSAETLHEMIQAGDRVLDSNPSDDRPTLRDDDRSLYLTEVRSLMDDLAGEAGLTADEREHMLSLLRDLERALTTAGRRGEDMVTVASQAVVADMVLRPDLWERFNRSPTAKRMKSTVAGLLLAAGAVGGYPGVKEFYADIFERPTVVQIEAKNEPRALSAAPHEEVYEGEIVDDHDEEPRDQTDRIPR